MANDIAQFIQNQGRIEPLNLLGRVEGLQAARQQNELARQRAGRENELAAALQGGDINAIAGLDPATATTAFDLQTGQSQQAARKMMAFAQGISNSANPKALFSNIQGNPEFQELAGQLGLDFSQVGDLSEVDDDAIRAQAGEMRDALGTFLTGSPFGAVGDTSLPSDVRSALAFEGGFGGLDPEAFQEAFLASKRTRQIQDIGGVPTDITGGGADPLSTLQNESNAAEVLAQAAQRGKEVAITEEVAPRGSAQRAVQLEKEAPGTFRSVEFAVSELDRFTEQAQLLRNHPGLETATGFGGEQLSGIPGTPAADAAALMDTLRSQSFVSALGAMRAASKTGGAVGNVSDAEGGRFENAFISLLQSQSFEQFVEQLDRLMGINADSRERIVGAYDQEFGEVPNAPKFETKGKTEKLPDFKNLSEAELRKLAGQ